jgi:hypothetical protein
MQKLNELSRCLNTLQRQRMQHHGPFLRVLSGLAAFQIASVRRSKQVPWSLVDDDSWALQTKGICL